MKRKTTITLTIAGLLGLAGVLYGSASFFSPVIDPQGNGPIGVAASPTDLIASEFCTANGVPFANIDRIDCQGGFSVLTTIPTIPGCYERYMAIAPLVSASATPAPFTPRDIFITQGPIIYQLRPPNPLTPFATIPDSGCSPDHTGITFDHVGTFDRNMIVTCVNGGVWKVDGAGTVTNIAFVTFNGEGRELEGPAVVPLSFGPHGGQIWAADENFPGAAPPGAVHTIDSNGNVTLNVVDHFDVESVQVIPDNPCTFCSGGAHFQAITIDNFGPVGIYQYFPADFAGLGGNVLLTSEGGVGTVLVTFDGTNYIKNFFDNIPGGIFEGSTFVDCNVPTPTPTPTATATFTPTPTPTPTSTPGGGVGTIGYWANHPNAWCVSSITLGCQTYTESEAIAIIKHPTGGDMTYALGAQLAAAKLNVNCAHADSSCVASAITAADSWLCSHPIGSNVSANSPAWQQIAATYNTLVNYNEGRLCAPRRR